MGQTGALVVVGEDEDLGLAGEPPEGGRVEDAVAVPFEAGAPGVGVLGTTTTAGSFGPGRALGQPCLLTLLAGLAIEARRRADGCPTVGVGHREAVGVPAGHGRRPPAAALAHVLGAFVGYPAFRSIGRSGPAAL